MSLEQLRKMPEVNQVVVKFRDGEKVRINPEGMTGLRSSQSNLLDDVLKKAGVSASAIKPLHAAPPERLESSRQSAQQRSGRRLPDLTQYFLIDLPPGASAAEVSNALNALDFVEFAHPSLRPSPPPIYRRPQALDPATTRQSDTTPNFVARQSYKGKAPRGIGPLSPIPGADGSGVTYVDMEYGWQLQHEDLKAVPFVTVDPSAFGDPWDEQANHGTAVLGIISGNPNNYGVTGIAPAADARVVGALGPDGYHPARAIIIAASELQPGDVIVIEAQTGVCGTDNDLGPLEWWQEVFDAVSSVTAEGIIVVAAAGNGRDNMGPGVNLDSLACRGAFDLRIRDSQAIIVGAGSSTNRSRLDFSSYGSRVTSQGWGENMATTGYGDAYNPSNNPKRYYTAIFAGTSSATPIVAGAVIVIQGVRKACGLPPATPLEMRNLLRRTGSKQAQPSTHIGPLPNIEAALKASVPANCLKKVSADATPG